MSDHKPYIVIFKDTADQGTIDSYIDQVQSKGGKLKQRFDSDIMKGFCADMPEEHSQELMTLTKGGEHEHIHYIEPDSVVETK